MGTIRIKKSKKGHWSPAMVERVFKSLKENLNNDELANLSEMMIAEKMFNTTGKDLMLSYLNLKA
ncbi:MAG: hypothetical protein H8D87_06345 [Deltaproteobacteria bacterium]|nr:hypothetical protein [Candidatus Desulfobacula maris]